jgi:hypothetical protein
VAVVKGQIITTFPDTANQELINFKTMLTYKLDELIESHNRRILEMEEFYSNKKEEIIGDKKEKEIRYC